MNLKDISSKLLIEALLLREGSRSIVVTNNESYKIQVSEENGSKDRYIIGRGKVMILEITI